MCEIKSGLMKGRVRPSELAGGREVDGGGERERERESARGRGLRARGRGERMLGGEGRQTRRALC